MGREADTDEQADYWFTRIYIERIENDRDAFKYWLDSNPANRAALERTEKAWEASAALKRSPFARQLLDEAWEANKLSRARKRNIGILGVLCLVTAGVTYLGFQSSPISPRKAEIASAAPNAGKPLVRVNALDEPKIATLPDGSAIVAAKGTLLTFRYDGSARILQLDQGRVRVIVKHDKRSTFTVASGNVSVVALGTVFDVERDARKTQVVLISGSVEVRKRAIGAAVPPVILKAGYQLDIPSANGTAADAIVTPTPIRSAGENASYPTTFDVEVGAWLDALSDAQGTPRVIVPERIRHRTVSGLSSITDPKIAADLVSKLYDLRMTKLPDGRIRLE
ncbi:hypothetical protein E5675_05575 [Sphingopyxis sp. PAMC25046]|uniref:FecR family protein n=1 Tax=Sphingopyxis sp. PAMC25046 TaxID=2565556 RepID=UPI00109DAFD9|nr:FecR domain-containing protein [Sphingopyxis sp. PAMC25046]QCB53957.1 hypothetical protein E5675_05575 [Sphingopyxis sp. PAMC25046]